jgi:hypothetical protein
VVVNFFLFLGFLFGLVVFFFLGTMVLRLSGLKNVVARVTGSLVCCWSLVRERGARRKK